MAKLKFITGEVKEVPYSVAAEINHILEGHREPKNDKQAQYVSLIEDVVFEPRKAQQVVMRRAKEPDLALRAMLDDPRLHGKEKFNRIGSYLRGRL